MPNSFLYGLFGKSYFIWNSVFDQMTFLIIRKSDLNFIRNPEHSDISIKLRIWNDTQIMLFKIQNLK